MKIVTISLFILLSVFSGCSENDPNITNPKNDVDSSYFPLKSGNKWVYEGYLFPYVLPTDTLECVSNYNKDSYTIFSFNSNFYFGYDDCFFNLRGNGEGLSLKGDSLFMFINKEGSLRKYLLIPPNTYVGRIDTIYLWGYEGMVTLETLSTDEIITVPAGTFNCLRVVVHWGINELYSMWFARGVGVVRVENHLIYDYNIIELQSYSSP